MMGRAYHVLIVNPFAVQQFGVDLNLHGYDLDARGDGLEVWEQQHLAYVLIYAVGLSRLAGVAVLSIGEFLSPEATLAIPRVPAGEGIQCVRL